MEAEINKLQPEDFRKAFVNAARRGFTLFIQVSLQSKSAYLLKFGGTSFDVVSVTPIIGVFDQTSTVFPLQTSFLRESPNPEIEVLSMAASHNRFHVVKHLLESGIDVNGSPGPRQQRCLYSPLFQSAARRNLETTKLLLDWGADINARVSNNGESALFGAVRNMRSRPLKPKGNVTGQIDEMTARTLKVIKLLLSNGADPMLAAQHGRTILNLAASTGNCEIMKLLLDAGTHPQIEHTTGSDEFTPLLCASSLGHEAAARLLLEKGANVNALSRNGLDALGNAIISNDRIVGLRDPCTTVPIITTLLEYGADIEGSQQPVPPLTQAVFWGNVPAVKALLSAGASTEKLDRTGYTPLEDCLIYYEGYGWEIFDLLLRAGANVNRNGPGGWTLLYHVCAHGKYIDGARLSIIGQLLSYGALIDSQSSAGFTPLNILCSNKSIDNLERVEIARLLLAHNAKLTVANREGATAFMSACQNVTLLANDHGLIETLLMHGADIN